MKDEKGSFMLILGLVISISILVFLFSQTYLIPAPVLSPDPYTSATSGQNEIQQMNAYKNDANRAVQQLQNKNNEIDKAFEE